MTILEIFEKVSLKTPIEQRKFFNYYDDSVNELLSLYEYVLVEGKTHDAPTTDLYGDSVVLPLYHNAIVDNILFMVSNDTNYKSEFLRKSKDAYLKYWHDKAKGKRIKKMRW